MKVTACKPNAGHRYITEIQAKICCQRKHGLKTSSIQCSWLLQKVIEPDRPGPVPCKMPVRGSSKFILPLHTRGASTLLPDGLSVASDLDLRVTASCGVYFRASKPRSHRGNRAASCSVKTKLPFCIQPSVLSFIPWCSDRDPWSSLSVSCGCGLQSTVQTLAELRVFLAQSHGAFWGSRHLGMA